MKRWILNVLFVAVCGLALYVTWVSFPDTPEKPSEPVVVSKSAPDVLYRFYPPKEKEELYRAAITAPVGVYYFQATDGSFYSVGFSLAAKVESTFLTTAEIAELTDEVAAHIGTDLMGRVPSYKLSKVHLLTGGFIEFVRIGRSRRLACEIFIRINDVRPGKPGPRAKAFS